MTAKLLFYIVSRDALQTPESTFFYPKISPVSLLQHCMIKNQIRFSSQWNTYKYKSQEFDVLMLYNLGLSKKCVHWVVQ